MLKNSLLLFILILFVPSLFSQNTQLLLLDELHHEHESIKRKKLNKGFGVKIKLEDCEFESFEMVQLHVLLKTEEGTLLPIEFKTLDPNLCERILDGTVELWFSDDWQDNLPEGYMPSLTSNKDFKSRKSTELVLVCFGSMHKELEWVDMERYEGIYWRRLTKDNRQVLASNSYSIK